MKKKVCMVVQDKMVKGGIAAVISGYYGSEIEEKYDIIYVESYMDGNKFKKICKAIQGYCHFAKVLLMNHPDIVHIHSSFGPSFYRKLPFIYMAFFVNKPIINHIHGADFDDFFNNSSKKKRALITKSYNRCTKIIALSDDWKKRLSTIVPEEKIAIVENYSILCENSLNERLARRSNNVVLFLGEIGKRKGCYDIPEVAEKVVKAVPNVRFVLAGTGDAADLQNVKELFKEKDIAEHVCFPGWVRGKEKEKLLREADVFFLPSYNEGMPMSVLDAMGYGLPVVSTNVGGIPQIVKENGACCTPGDISSMATAIIRLLTDEQKRKIAAKTSIDVVKNGYSLDLHLNRLEKIYESVCSDVK